MNRPTSPPDRPRRFRPNPLLLIHVYLFALLSGLTAILLIVLGIAGAWISRGGVVLPSEPMKRMAGAVSSAFLIELLGMENPHMPRPERSLISAKNAAAFLSDRFFQIDLFDDTADGVRRPFRRFQPFRKKPGDPPPIQ